MSVDLVISAGIGSVFGIAAATVIYIYVTASRATHAARRRR